VQRDNLAEMEQWLDAIANDKAPAKSALERVIRNRPKSVTDACYTGLGEKVTDMARCAQMFPVYSNPRLEAGMPIAATMLKCELKAVDSTDYSLRLTASQLASIRTTFPSGVCDFTKKGVAVGSSETWRKYGGSLPVDVSSIGSVAERREMPSDCRCDRSAKWSYLSPAKRVRLNTTTKWTRPLINRQYVSRF
jgi:hypothetical protein